MRRRGGRAAQLCELTDCKHYLDKDHQEMDLPAACEEAHCKELIHETYKSTPVRNVELILTKPQEYTFQIDYTIPQVGDVSHDKLEECDEVEAHLNVWLGSATNLVQLLGSDGKPLACEALVFRDGDDMFSKWAPCPDGDITAERMRSSFGAETRFSNNFEQIIAPLRKYGCGPDLFDLSPLALWVRGVSLKQVAAIRHVVANTVTHYGYRAFMKH